MTAKYLVTVVWFVCWLHADKELTSLEQVQANISRRNSVEQEKNDQPFIQVIQTGINDRKLIAEKLQDLKSQCCAEPRLKKEFYQNIQDVEGKAAPLLQDTTMIEAKLCQYQQENSQPMHAELLRIVANSHNSVQAVLIELTHLAVNMQDLQAPVNNQKPKPVIFNPKHKNVW